MFFFFSLFSLFAARVVSLGVDKYPAFLGSLPYRYSKQKSYLGLLALKGPLFLCVVHKHTLLQLNVKIGKKETVPKVFLQNTVYKRLKCSKFLDQYYKLLSSKKLAFSINNIPHSLLQKQPHTQKGPTTYPCFC